MLKPLLLNGDRKTHSLLNTIITTTVTYSHDATIIYLLLMAIIGGVVMITFNTVQLKRKLCKSFCETEAETHLGFYKVIQSVYLRR